MVDIDDLVLWFSLLCFVWLKIITKKLFKENNSKKFIWSWFLFYGTILFPFLKNLFYFVLGYSWLTNNVVIISVQSLSHVWLFAVPWTAAHQAFLSITSSQSFLKLMSIKTMMPSNHLIFCCPLLLPSIFPSIRVLSCESALPIWLWKFQVNSQGTQPYVYMYPFFPKLPFPSRLPQNNEQSSICYTVGPSWLSILNIAVCSCPSQIP